MTEIGKVGVCGAGGTMGAGIAIVAARAGFETLAYDVNDESLARTAKQTQGFFGKSVERRKGRNPQTGEPIRIGASAN